MLILRRRQEFSEFFLELGPFVFDGIEVWGVGGEEKEFAAEFLGDFKRLFGFMKGCVV